MVLLTIKVIFVYNKSFHFKKLTMKKLMCLVLTLSMLSFTVADVAVSLRYYNKDSVDHKFEVKTCGSKKTVTFQRSKTTTVTIQSGCREAVIYTKCGAITVKDDQNITIKNGCIKIN